MQLFTGDLDETANISAAQTITGDRSRAYRVKGLRKTGNCRGFRTKMDTTIQNVGEQTTTANTDKTGKIAMTRLSP